MASTYSSLKIQLMATGENSGTWGNVTNINLGTALEEAIVGSADVTFSSADVTLSLTDSNGSQTARNLRLNLVGTVAAPQNLIVPAIEKVYIVSNTLTQAITVKNSTGTGIAVAAGKTMYVYNNGTNVVDAITHLTSLTLGTPLPVSSGGTGSNSTTYVNLQSNVTGILPIANGGTGTNSTTFVNLTTNVTGVLPNANTTASSSNGASTIVARDSSGNFAANSVTVNTITANSTPSNLIFSSTGAITAPVGTTAERPSPATGMLRFNSTGVAFEGYNGSSWSSLGGAQGGTGNPFVYENDITVTANYTLTSGKNGISAGPITIDSGATVTVPDGSTWTIA
jgi:hypothetical protein